MGEASAHHGERAHGPGRQAPKVLDDHARGRGFECVSTIVTPSSFSMLAAAIHRDPPVESG
jgi:hypothetical protein